MKVPITAFFRTIEWYLDPRMAIGSDQVTPRRSGLLTGSQNPVFNLPGVIKDMPGYPTDEIPRRP
jgi:hypothetical protein